MRILERIINSLQAIGRMPSALRDLRAWSVWINVGLAVMLLTISIPTSTSAAVYAQQSQPKDNAEEEDAEEEREGHLYHTRHWRDRSEARG